MSQRTDIFDLGRLGLHSGEGRRLDVRVPLDPLEFGGQRYESVERLLPVRLDVSRTVGGYALHMTFTARLEGPCMRCLEAASPSIAVEAREVDQPGDGGDELSSPYVNGDELDLRAWAHDALVLAFPAQIICREECLGLCPICGENLNEAGPEHGHEQEPDPRWAKLRELRFE